MDKTDAQNGPDFGDLLSALDDANEAIQALGELVVTSVESGQIISKISQGLWVLFHQQTDDVRGIADQMRKLQAQRPSVAAPASKKLDPEHPDYKELIATNRETIAEIHALRADKEALRKEIIAEQLQDDFNTDEIAEAVNLKPEAVQRVIAQLLATTRPDLAPEQPAKTARR